MKNWWLFFSLVINLSALLWGLSALKFSFTWVRHKAPPGPTYHAIPTLWNNLELSIRTIPSRKRLKDKLTQHIMTQYTIQIRSYLQISRMSRLQNQNIVHPHKYSWSWPDSWDWGYAWLAPLGYALIACCFACSWIQHPNHYQSSIITPPLYVLFSRFPSCLVLFLAHSTWAS